MSIQACSWYIATHIQYEAVKLFPSGVRLRLRYSRQPKERNLEAYENVSQSVCTQIYTPNVLERIISQVDRLGDIISEPNVLENKAQSPL